jgi:flagellin
MNSLGVALENLTASESQIRDLDFASEVAQFTRSQILFAAGTSVLRTANLIPQNVLTLLA